MNLRQLSYFVQVAELGSFTRASAVLGIAQSALSRQLRALEEGLGVPLLLRNGRGVVLSDAGHKFLTRAKSLLDGAAQAQQEMTLFRDQPMGRVSLGLPASVATTLVVPLVRHLKARYPDIRLHMTEAYSGLVHEWLLNGRLDLGILYEPPPALASDRLATERLYLISGDRQRLGLATVEFAALARLPMILPGHPHAVRRLVDAICGARGLKLDVHMDVNAFSAIKDLVMQGVGHTILPLSPLLPELRAGQLEAVEIVEPTLQQTVGLAASSHHPLTEPSRLVVRAIQEVMKELIAEGAWIGQPGTRRPARPRRIKRRRNHLKAR